MAKEVIVTNCGNCPFYIWGNCDISDKRLDVYDHASLRTMPEECQLLKSEVVVKVNMNE